MQSPSDAAGHRTADLKTSRRHTQPSKQAARRDLANMACCIARSMASETGSCALSPGRRLPHWLIPAKQAEQPC